MCPVTHCVLQVVIWEGTNIVSRSAARAEKLQGQNWLTKFLQKIEVVGNKLPHPFILFVYLAIAIIVISWIVSLFDVTVVHPGSGETLEIRSLVSAEGLQFILNSMLENFTGFRPLGLVLAMMLGIGLAQKVGLFNTAIKKSLLKLPSKMITFGVFFIGIMGNIASDAAFIIVPPLAALIFYSVGRHPIAGLASGFAAVGIGFTANVLIAGTDALLSGIATEVAQTVESDAVVTPIDNWYFMSLSVPILATVGTIITERIVEPQLGKYTGPAPENAMEEVTPLEARALRNSGLAGLAYLVVIAAAVLVPNSPLRNEDGGIVPSPFLDGIVPIILFFFVTVAVAYGVTDKKITSPSDVPKFMAETMKDMAGYIVLIFAIAQFLAYFEWSNIATWIAVNGAKLLESLGLTGILAIVAFVLVTVVLSFFITSGSALWALEAPIFLPLFMVLGFDPGFVQVAYRIADSSTNMITPLNPYIGVILSFMWVYNKKAGFGTLISMMLPYTIGFLVIWIIMLAIFGVAGIPVGPGVTMFTK
ncbi:p-aminobenzoyl-glutamate transporter [Arthrobacter pigmenti]